MHKELGAVVETGGIAGAGGVAETGGATGAGGTEGAGGVAGFWGVTGAGDVARSSACIMRLGRDLWNTEKFTFSGCLPEDAKKGCHPVLFWVSTS